MSLVSQACGLIAILYAKTQVLSNLVTKFTFVLMCMDGSYDTGDHDVFVYVMLLLAITYT